MKQFILSLLFILPNILLAQETPQQEQAYVEFPEVEAEYPGGQGAMGVFIGENFKFHPKSLHKGEQGRAYVSFIVEADGSISNVEIVRSSGYKRLDKSAIEVVKRMPKWKPGEVGGKRVRTKCMLPINMVLD